MNIIRNTWHYKLFEFAMKHEKLQETVCSYLRGVTFGVLKVLLIALAVSTVIFSMINILVHVLTGALLVIAMFPEVIAVVITLVGILSWFAALIFGIIFFVKYLNTKEPVVLAFNSTTHSVASGIINTYNKIPKVKEGSFLDILWVRIKNQHDKICTLVTFTKD